VALFKVEKIAPRGPAGKWNVLVAEDMCKACGFCQSVCPVDVFAYRKTTNKIGWFPMYTAHEENCIGCMLCYQICPDFCIDVGLKTDLAAVASPTVGRAGAPPAHQKAAAH
jgi:NAD-dependent dihydropyrimidine dehydrogenase PreA subunit